MNLKTIIAAWLILISGSYVFAQSANFAVVADNKISDKAAEKNSEYVVSIEEAAKMRLNAAKEIEKGWKKVDWKATGISLVVPQEFEFVAHRDDKLDGNWQAHRWQSRLPQPNELGYSVWISVEEYQTRVKKTPAGLLKEEEIFLNQTDGSDVSDLPPITRLKINGVDGVISRWDVPNDVSFTWTAYRTYGGKIQKIVVQVSGREETMTGVRRILQSIKVV